MIAQIVWQKDEVRSWMNSICENGVPHEPR